MHGQGGSMTLVFTRAAVDRLAEPAEVFADARTWTEVVGLVSDDPPAILTDFADDAGIEPDYISSSGGQTGGLAVLRQQFSTDRHVVVGMTESDRQLAQSLGWEYLSITEAADAASWTLVAEDDP